MDSFAVVTNTEPREVPADKENVNHPQIHTPSHQIDPVTVVVVIVHEIVI